ncbi:MAG: KH domain-containing protein [Cyanobacteria bacterium P01_G01_bin.49]
MLKSTNESNLAHPGTADYLKLIRFLVEPLLESPDSLSIDCEQVNNNQRIWIRLAFEETDKGRVFGRGGRNLQAVRVVLKTAATTAGQFLHLDIYEESHQESNSGHRRRYGTEGKFSRTRPRSNRQNMPKLSVKSRWQQ